MASKYLFEVLDEIRAAEGNRSKIVEIISKNKTKPLAVICMANYGHPIATLVEEDLPEYKEDDSPLGMSFTTLAKETQNLDYFFKPGRRITKTNLQRLYINICEGLHPKEAQAFTDVILKRLCIEGLDYDSINTGFGEIFLSEPKELKHVDGNAT